MKWWQDLLGFTVMLLTWLMIEPPHGQSNAEFFASLGGPIGGAFGSWIVLSRVWWGKKQRTLDEKRQARRRFKWFTIFLLTGALVFIVLVAISV